MEAASGAIGHLSRRARSNLVRRPITRGPVKRRYVSASTLSIGDRVAPTKSVMSFIVAGEIEIIGIFPQNGFQAIRPGAAVKLVFAHSRPDAFTKPESLKFFEASAKDSLPRPGRSRALHPPD
jgi:hypothetical protein